MMMTMYVMIFSNSSPPSVTISISTIITIPSLLSTSSSSSLSLPYISSSSSFLSSLLSDQGYAPAQKCLGVCYDNGTGEHDHSILIVMMIWCYAHDSDDDSDDDDNSDDNKYVDINDHDIIVLSDGPRWFINESTDSDRWLMISIYWW